MNYEIDTSHPHVQGSPSYPFTGIIRLYMADEISLDAATEAILDVQQQQMGIPLTPFFPTLPLSIDPWILIISTRKSISTQRKRTRKRMLARSMEIPHTYLEIDISRWGGLFSE